MQLFLHLDVRHHLSADLTEAREPVRDRQETVFVKGGDIAGHVPAIAQHFRGFVRPAEIALHDIGSAHEQQTRLAQP